MYRLDVYVDEVIEQSHYRETKQQCTFMKHAILADYMFSDTKPRFKIVECEPMFYRTRKRGN
jgi:hypothetical protein